MQAQLQSGNLHHLVDPDHEGHVLDRLDRLDVDQVVHGRRVLLGINVLEDLLSKLEAETTRVNTKKKKETTTSIPTQAIIVWIEIARDSFEGKVANDVEDVEVAGENVPLAV